MKKGNPLYFTIVWQEASYTAFENDEDYKYRAESKTMGSSWNDSKQQKEADVPLEKSVPKHLVKFVKRKYYYFSRYDLGIKIDDEEGWFSVTAEPLAKYTAYFLKGVRNAIVVDCCCSVGGNLIQFALHNNTVFTLGVELDKTRIQYAKNNCCVYNVPTSKYMFVNRSISEVDFIEELELPQPSIGQKFKQLVFFFDPPWGGVDYKDKDKMNFEDFKPYPLKETLIRAFTLTQNIILKLPKNQDVNRLIEELKECYIESMTPEEKLDPMPLPTTFILFKEGSFSKFYLILTGDLVEYDYNVLVNSYLNHQKDKKHFESPVSHTSTKTASSSSEPNPERIPQQAASHRKVTMASTAPATTSGILPKSTKKILRTDDDY